MHDPRPCNLPPYCPSPADISGYSVVSNHGIDMLKLIEYINRELHIVSDGNNLTQYRAGAYRNLSDVDLDRLIYDITPQISVGQLNEAKRRLLACADLPPIPYDPLYDINWPAYEPIINGPNRYAAFANCIYDIDADVILPLGVHVGNDYIMDAELRPNLDCPEADEIYQAIMPCKAVRDLFFELVGYTLFQRRPSPPTVIMLYGPTETGKSALLNVVTSIIGRDNVSNMSLDRLMSRFGPANLEGKLANISDETPAKIDAENYDILKQLSGGDLITVERKFKEPYQFQNEAKLWFSANELPEMGSPNSALTRRLIIIPCRARQRWADQIYDTLTTPIAVSHAVNLAIEGFKRFAQRGYRFEIPSAVTGEISAFVTSQSPHTAWLYDYADSIEYHDIRASLDGCYVSEIYESYVDHVQKAGGRPLRDAKLSARLQNEYNLVSVRRRRMPYDNAKAMLIIPEVQE